MNIFGKDFIDALMETMKRLLKKAVKEIIEEINDEEKFLLNRKEISEAIGCDVNVFDENYRYRPGFPYHMKGSQEAWNKKEVFEYLHNNKLTK